MITDAEYVLERLQHGPCDAMQIISASIRERGVGLTVHSRVADLRADGYTITCGVEGKTRRDRPRWVYRLHAAGPVEPPAVSPGVGRGDTHAQADVNPDQLVLA